MEKMLFEAHYKCIDAKIGLLKFIEIINLFINYCKKTFEICPQTDMYVKLRNKCI